MTRTAAAVELIESDAGKRPFHSPARWTGCAASELDSYGYRVDEFLLTGEANTYHHSPAAGRAVVSSAAASPYRTRVMVVRPRETAAFSGNVVVELLNPSLRCDLSMFWPDVGGLAMADGDVFVGFTYKSWTAETLRRVDATRYGSLAIDDDRFSWDLTADVLDAVRAHGDGTLLGDLRATNVILTGGSQAGGFLIAFLAEGFHRPAGTDSPPTADGYLINAASAGFGPFGYIPVERRGEMPATQSLTEFFRTENVSLDDPRRITRGADVPVVQWLSETEALQDYFVARPDSDRPGDLYRCYQVPGRGHGAGFLQLEGLATDFAAVQAAGIEGMFDHFEPPMKHPETAFLLSATLESMRRWRDQGIPAPRRPRMDFDVNATLSRDEVGFHTRGIRTACDEAGHTTGGLRYPTIDHPVVRMWERPGADLAPWWGVTPMPPDEIRRRYGSVQRWLTLATGALDDAIADGRLRADHRGLFLGYLTSLVEPARREG